MYLDQKIHSLETNFQQIVNLGKCPLINNSINSRCHFNEIRMTIVTSLNSKMLSIHKYRDILLLQKNKDLEIINALIICKSEKRLNQVTERIKIISEEIATINKKYCI